MNNLRKLASILDQYTDEEINIAKTLNKKLATLEDMLIGGLRGEGEAFKAVEGLERKLAKKVINQLMIRGIINVKEIPSNYYPTHTSIK